MFKYDKVGHFDPVATVDAIRTGGYVTYDQAVGIIAEAFSVGMSRGWDAAEKYYNAPKSDAAQTHNYFPHPQYPWFCKHCGYPEHERLKHTAPSICETKGTDQ